MNLVLVLAVVFTCWTSPGTALADGMAPFSCGGGGPYNTCENACAVPNGGDCTRRAAGSLCGTEADGRCRDIKTLPPFCSVVVRSDGGEPPSIEDAEPNDKDAGAVANRADATSDVDGASDARDAPATELVCLVEPFCPADESGCSVAIDESRRRRLAGLPCALVVGGIFVLAVDRRRRRRPRTNGPLS
jgi:hypothetical protein